MNTEAIRQFFEEPANGWEARGIGAFVRYIWPKSEPPRWRTPTKTLHAGSSRAFLGSVPTNSAHLVDRALDKVGKTFEECGFKVEPSPPCNVILWDMTFPTPEEWDLPFHLDRPCPVTFLASDDGSSALILLPTHDMGRFTEHDQAWLESSAIHEGFHALLGRWVGRSQIMQLRSRDYWTKFEEMCAVALEVKLLKQEKAWMDFGRSWQATLGLSHCDNNWSVYLDPADGDFTNPVNREDYGHFALLAFLDEEVWSETTGHPHWLKVVWEEGRRLGPSVTPWEVLDRELKSHGGAIGLFLRYVVEATFPSKPKGVLAQLHNTFGRPASALLERGSGLKFFAIGPMAAQLLTCRLDKGAPAGLIRIVDYRSLNDTVVRAFEVDHLRVPVEIEVGEPKIQGKSKIWEVNLGKLSTHAFELELMVIQPNHAGRSLAFTAEWT